MSTITKPLTVYLPDTRGVVLEQRYGKGNLKIGPNVYTYSRLPGMVGRFALGLSLAGESSIGGREAIYWAGTCPGATPECQRICYASRPVAEGGVVFDMWNRNTITNEVPPIPDDADLLRIHVSGDFDTPEYIDNWILRLEDRPDVACWAYTRSWRVPSLLERLEKLRALEHVQLFASMDKSHTDVPPEGWRRAWIDEIGRAHV